MLEEIADMLTHMRRELLGSDRQRQPAGDGDSQRPGITPALRTAWQRPHPQAMRRAAVP